MPRVLLLRIFKIFHKSLTSFGLGCTKLWVRLTPKKTTNVVTYLLQTAKMKMFAVIQLRTIISLKNVQNIFAYFVT